MVQILSPDSYAAQVDPKFAHAFNQLRAVVKKNIPLGFEETMSYGMIGYVVPHRIYPSGYHCDTSLPLPFLSIAAQKNFIGFYHMGIYVMPELLSWFQYEYQKAVPTKLDMGKSCIRLKKPDQIPFDLLGELVTKVNVDDWISVYEGSLKR